MCASGTLTNSTQNLKNAYIIKNTDVRTPVLGLFFLITYNIIKSIIPSKAASYNIDGCLGNMSTVGKITPHSEYVGSPYNSELIKLPILPKNNPMGIKITKKSDNLKNLILLLLLMIRSPIQIPINAPWNDIPPSHMKRTFIGLAL